MISLFIIVLFVLCFAITIICILIGHEMIHTYGATFHRNYFYYLIAFFAFAIYAIWGQIGMYALLASIETKNEVKVAVTNFIPILGIPFLIITWLMLLKMAYALVNVPFKKAVYAVHFILFSILIIAASTYFKWNHDLREMDEPIAPILIALILCIDLIYMILFAVIVIRRIKMVAALVRKKIIRFTLLMIVGLALRCVALAFYSVGPWVLGPLILLFFISNLFPLLFMRVNSDSLFQPIGTRQTNTGKKELLYQKFQITRREQEIIEQLCLGKTNQQIADALFISLQTVKDHTHRIYNKVGINSRMKLVRLVNE